MPTDTALDTDTLLTWFAEHGRDLPWRRPDCTPWGVLVSEIMLQQTPVARVVPLWEEWLDRWPRPSALAAASQGEVLRAWGKLGYPRRALRLHAAAAAIARDHDDVVPADVDTLLALPGIGAYTARAVAAFAYGRRAPVVDTNVRRVVARAVHGAGDAGRPSTTRDMADVEALLPAEESRAARLSAALMELGALVCTARGPRCADCPVYDSCAWQRAGRPAYEGPAKPVQRYGGTDRHVRGLLLDVLRGTSDPVPKERLDVVWSRAGQRDRCLDSLLVDGLVEQTADGRFALPGEHR
ncbi:A/G-specific adenine glycosylase [Amycolatopsis arida]|uniref:Adenine DNA glycosylase n=1 Tax=Amycolatopsis arida TaxID=587909 RepID=A0A1I5R4C1_9PSEU|nr:A/G-specific adenine glycosylase [Amycolatopsis arida]TDX99073.1 A/G-specific adenine glycosylase [Amycolatopsis arida]SFP53335.1 A/G-specific adenine glycosylase [Amycolatopsis arida]